MPNRDGTGPNGNGCEGGKGRRGGGGQGRGMGFGHGRRDGSGNPGECIHKNDAPAEEAAEDTKQE